MHAGLCIHLKPNSAAGLPVRGKMIFTDMAAIAGGIILTVLARIVTEDGNMLRPINQGTEMYVAVASFVRSVAVFLRLGRLGTLSRSEVFNAGQDHDRVSIAALLVAV